MTRRLPLLALIFLLSACGQEGGEFPGFTAIKVNGKDSGYMIERASIKPHQKGVSFNLLQKLEDGYIIQRATTDCGARLGKDDGLFYGDQKGAPTTAPGSTLQKLTPDDLALHAVIADACRKDAPAKTQDTSNTAETAGVHEDDIAPMITPVGITAITTQAGFLTREITTMTSPDEIAPAGPVVKNGTEATVTGKSENGEIYEVAIAGQHGKLYIPADAIALFSPE